MAVWSDEILGPRISTEPREHLSTLVVHYVGSEVPRQSMDLDDPGPAIGEALHLGVVPGIGRPAQQQMVHGRIEQLVEPAALAVLGDASVWEPVPSPGTTPWRRLSLFDGRSSAIAHRELGDRSEGERPYSRGPGDEREQSWGELRPHGARDRAG